MDVVSDVLRTVRLQNRCYGRLELTAPWGIEVEAGDPRSSYFYVVSQGCGRLELDGGRHSTMVADGDFVLLPTGERHVLRDASASRTVPLSQLIARHDGASRRIFRHGGGGAPASIVGGNFTVEGAAGDALLASLPPMIHVKSDGSASVQWLEATLQFLATETALARPGAETVISRLTDILFVQGLRAHMASLPDHSWSWLRALKDPPIATALRLLHEQPEQPWTVEGLAEQLAMSRSAFAARFRELVGEPPLSYLTRWRLQKAADRMRQSDATLRAIAREVGYETESAFGKAFRRQFGVSPGEYRKQGLGGRRPPPDEKDRFEAPNRPS
jgi:AraC-like DNA-binding protein